MVSLALQSAGDKAIADTLAALAMIQEQHYTAARRYAQLLPTHATPPADGVETAPDKADVIQDGVASSWSAVRMTQTQQGEGLDAVTVWETAPVPLPATLPCSLQVDTYSGPQGDGYVLVATVIEKGVTYCRCVGVGPEKRDMDWGEVA